MTTAHAGAILARIAGHMEANWVGGFFTRGEMEAALHLLGEARAERDRLRHDLAAEGWQPLPADWHARADLAAAITTAVAEVSIERDGLQQALTEEERQSVHYRDQADLLAGQVQRVRAVCVDGAVIVYAHDVLRALDGPAQ